jgi:hypothetical protein
MAAPMPRLPPVTNATLPFKFCMVKPRFVVIGTNMIAGRVTTDQ